MAEHAIQSTADLTPDGILGYAKGLAAAVTAVLIAVIPFLPDGDWQNYAQTAVAILGALAVYSLPNAVKPAIVTEPLRPE